ncbi:MAG: T9SS type A sorting domain-containing protein, partial [Balneolaceae bacterium]
LWVEVDELDENRISEGILDEIMDGLIRETPSNSVDPGRGIIEIGRDFFGSQPNVDGTGVLKILIADIQDGWDPPEQNFFTAGFFDPVNLLPREEHENSNFSDILYINSKPGIYREETGVVSTRLNTMAHEFQHLIHANYRNLTVFQNEGQSELAEILSGFNARAMNFLNSRTEVSGDIAGPDRWIYRFRSDESDVVLYDYQRAQLLHSYLEERVGPGPAASLTRSDSSVLGNPDLAYSRVLAEEGLSVPLFLTDFYIAAYESNLGDAPDRFAFSRPQLSNIRVANPGILYNAEVQPWVIDEEEEIYYGGSLYTQWFGVEDLVLDIHSSEGISQNILYRILGEDSYRYMEAVPGMNHLEPLGGGAIYEEIVLVSTNVEPSGESPLPGDSRTFRYSGEWTSTNLAIEELAYHTETQLLLQLPGAQGDMNAVALRISPEFDSGVQSIRLNINPRESAVQGEGRLALTLREAVSQEGFFEPGQVLADQPVDIGDIAPGPNFIGVDSNAWLVEEGEEYFVTVEVTEDTGLYLELLLDSGTTSQTDPDYNPARTLGLIREAGEFTSYTTFRCPPDVCEGERNNLIMGVNLVGFRDLEDIGFPDPPVSDSFELNRNYPNPFSAGTTIGYNVPESAEIEITLHDVLGRKVTELINGEVPAGFHTVRFDPESLASGVYFYRLVARGNSGRDFSGVKQMTFIR